MKNGKGERNKKSDINLTKLNSTATRVVYWMFQILILCTMMFSLVSLFTEPTLFDKGTHIEHIMLCVVSLVLYNVPSIAQRRFKLYVPSAMHIFVLLFIFAHFILGEVFGTYKVSAIFDKLLHTTSGLAIALGGFSLVNILNDSRNTHLKLSPLFVALFSFCFALAIALLWEVLEFTSDSLFGTNMQRYIPPENVEQAVPPKQGYGLIDTMGDMIVSTAAAFVVSVLGYVALRKKTKYLNRFLLRKIPDYDTAIAEAEEAGDTKLVEALKKARDEVLKQSEEESPEKEKITDESADGELSAPQEAQLPENGEEGEEAQPQEQELALTGGESVKTDSAEVDVTEDAEGNGEPQIIAEPQEATAENGATKSVKNDRS
ncbi:MAG: DUF2238 domain-containing protein [Clostridia bacterium]|jgi:hypothetical protein|nr:DUF2238 domain-containing protein [Clostridia bacterium]